MAERTEARQEKKERKEREKHLEKQKERQEKEKQRKREKKELKRRGRNTSSAGDISSSHHQPSPTTDARQIPPGGDQWKLRGGTTNTTGLTDDTTSPTGTGKPMPVKAVHSQTMVSQIDQSMIMTGNYDRLEQPTEEIPSVGVTTRPVIEPVDSLRPSQDDNVTSHSTRLLKAEIERDQYKEEMEELRAQIIRLKIKSSIDSNMVYSQSPDEREHLMREELKAKEREVNDLKQKLASQERESEEALVLSEKRSKSLEEKVKLLEVDNQGLKMQSDVVNADIILKNAEQNQNEKKEAELISELEKVKEEKEIEINRRDARIKYLLGELNKFNNETVPNLERKLEDKERKQKNLLETIEDLKRENHRVATQAVEGVAWKERETEELKKRLEEMEGEREENEAKLRETIDNLQHQLNEAIKVPPIEDGASANSSLTDEEKAQIILDMKEKEIKELTEKIAMLERGNDDHAAIVAQLAEVDREKQEMENEREELKRQISISDRLVAENEELKGRLLAYERYSAQDNHQHGHESLGQQRGNLDAQFAKYKMKERELQEELTMKEKHMMELNEKLTKRNEIVTKLNDKLSKLNEENKRLHISMVIDEEKRKADQVRAETDREGVKREVTDAYNEIQRLTDVIYGLNEEIETMKQEHVNEKERLLTTINDQSNTIKQHVEVGEEMVGKISQQHSLVEEKEETIATLNKTIDELEQQVTKFIEENNEAAQNINEKQLVINQKELELKKLIEELQRTKVQEHVNEKERLLVMIKDQINIIKQHKADKDKLIGEMSQQHLLVEEKEQTIAILIKATDDHKKTIEVMNRQHQEKEEIIKVLMVTLEEKTNNIAELKQQVARVHKLNIEANENANNKQLVIEEKEKALKELTEHLQIAQVQLQEYADGFNSERKDRERMSSELDEKRAQVLELQKSLQDETHTTKVLELEAKYHSLQDIVQQQKNELSMKDEAAKDWEEEKHMLTTQANSYARQGDELKKSLSELRDKCKSLEHQLMKKTEIESEVYKLKQELEDERNSKQHLVAAFNQEKVKLTVVEQEKVRLEGILKIELAEKAQLQQFIAQEQAKAEDEMTKSTNANKILREKLQATEAQLAYIYQSQSRDRPGPSGSLHNYQMPSPQGPTISQRRNYPPTENIGYHQDHSHIIVQGTSGYPYHHNEQYSYSQDIPPPQMNLQQMQQYSRHALQQRELQQQQQQQQLGELYRVRGEEMRRRDEDLRQLQEEQEEKRAIADRELAELDELKRKLKRRETERKLLPSHYQYSSRNEEMVSGSANQPEKKSPENSLLVGLDDEIQYYAEEVRKTSQSPVIAEVQEDDDSSLPYDPNLVCSKCGKQYRIGQIQYFRCHLEGLCHPDTEDVIAKGNLTEEIAFYAEEVRRMSRQPNTEEVMREDDDSSIPYDPNLVCPKCGKQYRKGQIQYLRRHMKEFCL